MSSIKGSNEHNLECSHHVPEVHMPFSSQWQVWKDQMSTIWSAKQNAFMIESTKWGCRCTRKSQCLFIPYLELLPSFQMSQDHIQDNLVATIVLSTTWKHHRSSTRSFQIIRIKSVVEAHELLLRVTEVLVSFKAVHLHAILWQLLFQRDLMGFPQTGRAKEKGKNREKKEEKTNKPGQKKKHSEKTTAASEFSNSLQQPRFPSSHAVFPPPPPCTCCRHSSVYTMMTNGQYKNSRNSWPLLPAAGAAAT